MDYYAFINEQNEVVEIMPGRNADEIVDGISDWEKFYSELRNQKCLITKKDGSIRKNFAYVGFTYDAELDAFIAPKPWDSWVLDDECCWQPPKPYPNDDKMYAWSEDKLDWVLVV